MHGIVIAAVGTAVAAHAYAHAHDIAIAIATDPPTYTNHSLTRKDSIPSAPAVTTTPPPPGRDPMAMAATFPARRQMPHRVMGRGVQHCTSSVTDGAVFGRYTTTPWSRDGKYHASDNAFLFALSRKK